MKGIISTIFSLVFIGLCSILFSCQPRENRNSHISESGIPRIANNSEYTKSFPEYGFSITAPCQLEDVSAQSGTNILINLGGTTDGNDISRMAAYQFMVTRLPVGYRNINRNELTRRIDNLIRQQMSRFRNVEQIRVGYEGFPGYLCYTEHNGLQQKGMFFAVNNYIIAMTVMTNNDLETKFNKFSNGFKIINTHALTNEHTTDIAQNSNRVSPHLPKVYNHSKFSFNYPSQWAIFQENSRVTNQTTIAVQIMDQSVNDDEFAPNINVITCRDKHYESTAQLARISFNQIRDAGLSCYLNGITDLTIDGCTSSLADYVYNAQGFSLRVLQYIAKKSDNTTFVITITLDNNSLVELNF